MSKGDKLHQDHYCHSLFTLSWFLGEDWSLSFSLEQLEAVLEVTLTESLDWGFWTLDPLGIWTCVS